MTYQPPLPAPPEVTQEPHQCWSAAYESWSYASAQVVNGATPVSEESIEATIGAYPNALNENGGATFGGIGLLTHVGNMDLEGLPPADLTEALAERKLRESGYLYLVFYAYGRNGVFSHAVVIYGTNQQGLMVMDPGRGRGLMIRPARYYRQTIVMLLGTHSLAR
ncbi:MAG: hypothetical protein GY952_14625 [Rhodobacteraceae bacterium]|nr:hypothetical protein [Paracoccaceae bacterium]